MYVFLIIESWNGRGKGGSVHLLLLKGDDKLAKCKIWVAGNWVVGGNLIKEKKRRELSVWARNKEWRSASVVSSCDLLKI